jgi:RNase H-fold protein (predicted Holliday junction resolvase)
MWGGTKNGGKNKNQKGLPQIKNFVENHNQTNIIVISIPHRYDLQINSCVNNYIKVFNRKLRKQWKVFDNAFLIKVNLDTDQFTRHSLNLNSKGKEQSTKKTVITIHIKGTKIKTKEHDNRQNVNTCIRNLETNKDR